MHHEIGAMTGATPRHTHPLLDLPIPWTYPPPPLDITTLLWTYPVPIIWAYPPHCCTYTHMPLDIPTPPTFWTYPPTMDIPTLWTYPPPPSGHNHPLLVTSGSHHWRLVQTCSIVDLPTTSADIWWWPPKHTVRILLECFLFLCADELQK